MKPYKFSQYSDLRHLSHNLPLPEDQVPKLNSSKEDNVLNIIFAIDPVTGRPRSDLGTYLTDETNPLIREYIERQLRTDFTSSSSVNVPEGISDDDLVTLTRDRSETVDDYVKRVNDYCLRQRSKVQSELQRSEYKRRLAAFRQSKSDLKE